MHEKGVYTVEYGSIYNKDHSVMMDNIGLIIDKETGTVYKIGDTERTDIEAYYQNIINKYRESGLSDMADNLIFVAFDRYRGILDIDEICTLVNYFFNHIGEKLMETLSLDEVALKEKIKHLQDVGF